jgi:hypothetical protein
MVEDSKKKEFKSELIGEPVKFVGKTGKQYSISRQRVEGAKNDSVVIESIGLSRTGIPFKKPSSIWISALDVQEVVKSILSLEKKK